MEQPMRAQIDTHELLANVGGMIVGSALRQVIERGVDPAAFLRAPRG